MSTIQGVPAYGRDYKNARDLQADWDAGKDFQSNTGQYFNNQDIDARTTNVVIAYKGRRAFYTVKGTKINVRN